MFIASFLDGDGDKCVEFGLMCMLSARFSTSFTLEPPTLLMLHLTLHLRLISRFIITFHPLHFLNLRLLPLPPRLTHLSPPTHTPLLTFLFQPFSRLNYGVNYFQSDFFR